MILGKESLNKVIRLIFDKKFCNFLTSLTGYNYTVDFFGAYQNFYIPKEERNKPWYANHYHLDKPNSNNLLKIFLPISLIGFKNGPLAILDIDQTKDYFSKKTSAGDAKKIYLIGEPGDLFLCKLNLCLHKACIPQEGETSDLIMIQLNPSKRWYLNENIYQRQFGKEPKFSSLQNQFLARKLINY